MFIESDLNTLLDRLRSQIAAYHDGTEGEDPEAVTDGSLRADNVVAAIQGAAMGDHSLAEAMAQSDAYTDFDIEDFLRTYPDTFQGLMDDV